MASVRFVVEQVEDGNGGVCSALVRYKLSADAPQERDQWGTIPEFDQLFQAASDKWGDGNWDLNKVITAIREADFQ